MIFVRSRFRIAKLLFEFHGPLANSQISFMILDGPVVVTTRLALTTLLLGLCFQGEWRAANFKMGETNRPRDVEGRGYPWAAV